MEITLEMAERLRAKADVTYAQAKEALEYSGGNLLDALIYLEEKGMIPRADGAYYSTRSETPPPPLEPIPTSLTVHAKKAGKTFRKKGGIRQLFAAMRRGLVDNELEIWRKGQPITALPVLILILLVLCVPYITVPTLVFGLFLGFRYRFSGPDLDQDELNSVITSVADTAADLGRQVMDELRAQHEKHSRDGDK